MSETQNLEGLSVEELAEIERKAHEAKVQKQLAMKPQVLEQIVAVAKLYNITASEISKAISEANARIAASNAEAAQAGTIKPRYRDPVSGKTWAGRGKEPTWMVKSGKDRSHFLIPGA